MGFPPVPLRMFSRWMLFPVLQFVQTWWTFTLIECHAARLAMIPFAR
jgi:hypothetical protein